MKLRDGRSLRRSICFSRLKIKPQAPVQLTVSVDDDSYTAQNIRHLCLCLPLLLPQLLMLKGVVLLLKLVRAAKIEFTITQLSSHFQIIKIIQRYTVQLAHLLSVLFLLLILVMVQRRRRRRWWWRWRLDGQHLLTHADRLREMLLDEST